MPRKRPVAALLGADAPMRRMAEQLGMDPTELRYEDQGIDHKAGSRARIDANKTPAWNGMCPAGKHGLDFEGQDCDVCTHERGGPCQSYCRRCNAERQRALRGGLL